MKGGVGLRGVPVWPTTWRMLQLSRSSGPKKKSVLRFKVRGLEGLLVIPNA